VPELRPARVALLDASKWGVLTLGARPYGFPAARQKFHNTQSMKTTANPTGMIMSSLSLKVNMATVSFPAFTVPGVPLRGRPVPKNVLNQAETSGGKDGVFNP